MNVSSKTSQIYDVKCYQQTARVSNHRIYSFQKENSAYRNQGHRIYLQLRRRRNNNRLVVVPSIARLTVWQQEHCTLVAPRMYIRSVWHPPQTNWAISVPAPNASDRFDSEIFHLKASTTAALAVFQKIFI